MPLPSIAFGHCGVQPPYDVPRRLAPSRLTSLFRAWTRWFRPVISGSADRSACLMYLVPHLQGRLDPSVVGFRSHEDLWDLHAITTCTLWIS